MKTGGGYLHLRLQWYDILRSNDTEKHTPTSLPEAYFQTVQTSVCERNLS